VSLGDDRPRFEQLRTQVGPFNPADLDEDGGFNVDKWLARLTIKHVYWEDKSRLRKDWGSDLQVADRTVAPSTPKRVDELPLANQAPPERSRPDSRVPLRRDKQVPLGYVEKKG
jgi:hypothetical protein